MQQRNIPPLVLCVLDGWGKNDSSFGNAVIKGDTPVFDILDRAHPPISINASSGYVGLPEGQMGNSEVGHLNIGAGRVVLQDLPKINSAIEDGSFFTNTVITDGMRRAIKNGSRYHLFGLVSDGGVHSHINHIRAFLEKAKQEGLPEVYIHALMDGRDTPPDSGAEYIRKLLGIIEEVGIGKISTIAGRYYTMDRDNRWNRVEKGFNAIVHGKAEATSADPVQAILNSYENGVTDEFIIPTVITDEKGDPTAKLKSGDVFQIFNFRADRVRQITRALSEKDFDRFDRSETPDVSIICMTQYSEDFDLPAAFEKEAPKNGLGEFLSSLDVPQFRTAETEKYAHVTYFFNGGLETQFSGENRRLVPSPMVATYDLKPEMSAYEVADNVVSAVKSAKYRFIVVNFANGDMVGHTGIFEAALKAVETVDACIGRIMEAVRKVGGWLVITADHGNVEEMVGSHDEPITSHSTNLVPFYVVGPEKAKLNPNGGALCDVAPTVLSLMNIPQPDEMTGSSLIVRP